MDIFQGNKIFEERIFKLLNWGVYLRDTSKGRLTPFIFLFKESEQVKIIAFQEDEDNFERAKELLKKREEIFDQFFIGYEGEMILDETNQPVKTIIIKGFDKRQDTGIFMVQKFELKDDKFRKIGNPVIVEQLPLEFEKIIDNNQDLSIKSTSTNEKKEKNETGKKIVKADLIGNNENELALAVRDILSKNIQSFNEYNLLGNFEINIKTEYNLNIDFLKYLINDVFYTIIGNSFVVQNFTGKGIAISLNANLNNKQIYSDSTKYAVDKIANLLAVMNKDDKRDYSKSNISCPECKWVPDGGKNWQCTCRFIWDTFQTKGKCPKCETQWNDTWCPKCKKTSKHQDWYHSNEKENKSSWKFWKK